MDSVTVVTVVVTADVILLCPVETNLILLNAISLFAMWASLLVVLAALFR